ncbi:MAG: SurA N-terminal domain-containing protein, partial [Terriglobales bacterium]
MKTNPLVRLFVAALLAVSLLGFCLGCGSKSAGDDVAATVDGRKIYQADVEKYFDNQTAGSQQRPVGEQATSLRLSILRELV